eukprot:3941033-Rhodomonas_salina.1
MQPLPRHDGRRFREWGVAIDCSFKQPAECHAPMPLLASSGDQRQQGRCRMNQPLAQWLQTPSPRIGVGPVPGPKDSPREGASKGQDGGPRFEDLGELPREAARGGVARRLPRGRAVGELDDPKTSGTYDPVPFPFREAEATAMVQRRAATPAVSLSNRRRFLSLALDGAFRL